MPLLVAKDRFAKKLFIAISLLVAIGAAFFYVATSDSKKSSHSEQSKVLNRGLIGEPESLHPHQFSSDQAATILRDIGEGLVSNASNGNLTPGVAESWEVSGDGLLYTFRIRRNAYWSNGDPITANDFVRTYRMLVDPTSGSVSAATLSVVENAENIIRGNLSANLLGVTAKSENILEVRLRNPTPYFLQMLTHPSLFPVYPQSKGTKNRRSSTHVGNGAYTLSVWTQGSEIVLQKNEHYWAAKDVYFTVVRYHITNEIGEFNRFRAGEIDVTGTVASGSFSTAQRNYPSELRVSNKLGVYYYGFNLQNPIFADNPDLRRALSLAIDRRLLVEKVLARGEQPAFSWVPPGTFNYQSQDLAELQLENEQRESEARRLYSSAGFGTKKPLKFQLRFNESDVQQRIALAISSMWRDVLGAEVELVSEEFQVLLANIREGDVTDVFRLSWTGDYNDAQAFLDLFETGHPQNLTRYSNTIFDDLIRAARLEVDSVERRTLLEAAERIALSDHAVIPIYFYVSKHLVRDGIAGWNSNVLDIHLSRHLRRSQ